MTIYQTMIAPIRTQPLRRGAIAVGAIALLILSAKIQVPMIPVPITLQSAVVLCLACLLGWRGALAVLGGYFALGFAGLPVFAMAPGAVPGPAYFAGPTGGYLLGFAMAAGLIGYAYEQRRHWNAAWLLCLMLAGHAVILAVGTAWLAYGIPIMGAKEAFMAGVMPFLTGSVLKSAIAAGFVKALGR